MGPRALHAIRMVLVDVTGTMIRFKGHIGDIYCKAASIHARGICPGNDQLHAAFTRAYDETCQEHKAFGGPEFDTKEWWRKCVQRSFDNAGFHFKPHVAEKVFHHIYSSFGSHEAYEVFEDVIPFLSWLRENRLIVGVVSNSCERYEDSILPMLGVYHKLDFVCLSKLENVEKPDPRLFEAALRIVNSSRGYNLVKPEEVYHIGDSYEKDHVGAKAAGMHPILLDRFKSPQADTWRAQGAHVLNDLTEVRQFLELRKCSLRPSRWWEEAEVADRSSTRRWPQQARPAPLMV